METKPNPAALPAELSELLRADDQASFDAALDTLLRQREQSIFRALGTLARDLHDAIKRLSQDIATHPHEPVDLQSARQRLQEVLDMGARAAHRNLDIVERLRPQAQALNAQAETALAAGDNPLARQAADFAHTCQQAFTEMVLEQSWQDLAGQRVKQVDAFIGRVDQAMRELVQLTGALSGGRPKAEVQHAASQDDVDRMLAEFGF